MEVPSSLNHKTSFVFLVIILLLLANILTVIHYKNKINNLKKQSPFVTISQNTSAESLKHCLTKHGIDYKIENNEIKVRAVEQNDAISNCS